MMLLSPILPVDRVRAASGMNPAWQIGLARCWSILFFFLGIFFIFNHQVKVLISVKATFRTEVQHLICFYSLLSWPSWNCMIYWMCYKFDKNLSLCIIELYLQYLASPCFCVRVPTSVFISDMIDSSLLTNFYL